MMATAVAPITTPIKARRRNGSGMDARTGEAGCSSRALKSTAETMNRPSSAPSIRYSGQWRLHGVDDALGAISFEERQRQPADREDLVGAKGGVDRAVSVVHVDHVVQVPSVRVPEAFQEGPATEVE